MSFNFLVPLILILAKALCLFISAGVTREFAVVPDVYILLSPKKKEVHSSS